MHDYAMAHIEDLLTENEAVLPDLGKEVPHRNLYDILRHLGQNRV